MLSPLYFYMFFCLAFLVFHVCKLNIIKRKTKKVKFLHCNRNRTEVYYFPKFLSFRQIKEITRTLHTILNAHNNFFWQKTEESLRIYNIKNTLINYAKYFWSIPFTFLFFYKHINIPDQSLISLKQYSCGFKICL